MPICALLRRLSNPGVDPRLLGKRRCFRLCLLSLLLTLEEELKSENELALVPLIEKLSLVLINFPVGNLESYRLIRFCSKQKVLPVLIRCFFPLLISGHESVSWLQPFHDLWILHIEQQAELLSARIFLFYNPISRASDLNGFPRLNFLNSRSCNGSVPRFSCCSPSEIALVPPSLCMGQIIPFVIVQSQAQLAFIRPKMISHQIRILF
mmetsp:Transcript_5684/g.8010  ORF Transcript_5684/g.8010 Transcript_5684/m.8010 type:complete len:209 (-) Transcript_5684:112-738(-)